MPTSELLDLLQTGVVSVIAIGVIIPLARALASRITKPATQPRLPAPVDTDRLERMERAIEAIAVEVERVAESQRFLTRVLTKGEREHAPALSAPR